MDFETYTRMLVNSGALTPVEGTRVVRAIRQYEEEKERSWKEFDDKFWEEEQF